MNQKECYKLSMNEIRLFEIFPSQQTLDDYKSSDDTWANNFINQIDLELYCCDMEYNQKSIGILCLVGDEESIKEVADDMQCEVVDRTDKFSYGKKFGIDQDLCIVFEDDTYNDCYWVVLE